MRPARAWLALRPRLPNFGLAIRFRSIVFCLGTLLIGMVAMDAGINLLMIIFGLCLGAIVISPFAGAVGLRHLTVRRAAPETIVAGQTFQIRYTVRNEGRWACVHAIHVIDRLDPEAPVSRLEGYVHRLRPGETVLLTVPACARRRGRLRLTSIRLSTGFPFGLVTKSVAVAQEQDLIVFPALARLLRPLELPARAADAPGQGSPSARIRGDEEFYGVREYRAGDNPRRIHWRSSARMGTLMIREMSKPSDRQVWCVLNTRADDRSTHELQRLEAAISAVATVVCDTLEAGGRVGLICNGEPLLVLPPGGGRSHRPRLLRELALRARNPQESLAPHIERLAWPATWRGCCLLFGAADGDDLRSSARALRRAIGPTVAFVPGTPAFDEQFAAAQGAALGVDRPPVPHPAAAPAGGPP
jgi:uncharacterized protein (DUF58 family)